MAAIKFAVKAQKAMMMAFTTHGDSIDIAGQGTVERAAEIAKQKGRLSIRAGGPSFNGRWPNALRSEVYPKHTDSANAAALIFIRSEYAGIFEDGGTVKGVRRPYLWLPLKDTPKFIRDEGRRKRISPALYAKHIGPYSRIDRPGKPPLLVAFVRGTEKRLAGDVTRSQLKRGLGGRGKETRMVPIFVGIRQVTISKKWNIRRAAQEAVAMMPGIYTQLLRRATGRRVFGK